MVKVTCEQRLEGGEGISHKNILGERILALQTAMTKALRWEYANVLGGTKLDRGKMRQVRQARTQGLP